MLDHILERIRSIDSRIDDLTQRNQQQMPVAPVQAGGSAFQQVLADATAAKAQNLRLSTTVEDAINKASSTSGVPATLLKAIVQAESGGRINAVSPVGAKGLMQLMDSTAHEVNVTDSFDPYQNVRGGAEYIKKLLAMFGGDLSRAIAAYNAGPNTILQNKPLPAETKQYVRQVLANYQSLGGSSHVTAFV